MKKIKAVGYLRISTSTQKEGVSLEVQAEKIKKYCEAEDRQLVRVYKDVMSGAKLKLPAQETLLRDAEQGKFQELIVFAIDRLGRSNVGVLLFIEKLRKLGINFVSLRERVDLNRPFGEVILSIFTSYAKAENEARKERIIASKIFKFRNGNIRSAAARPKFPLRWSKDGKSLEPDPEKLALFNDIVRWRLSGLSLDKICIQLNALPPKIKVIKTWHKARLTQILKSHKFLVEGKQEFKFGGKEVELRFPPLLDEKAFEELKKVSEKNLYYNPKAKKESLLAGMLICGRCGAPLHQKRRAKLAYFVCSNRTKDPKCSLPYLPQKKAEVDIWHALEGLFKSPQKFEAAIRQANRELSNVNLKELSEIDEGLDRQELEVRRGQHNLIKAVELGDISREDTRKRKAELDGELQRISQRRGELAQTRAIRERNVIRLEELHQTRLWFHQRVGKMTFEEKRRFLKLLTDGKANIKVDHYWGGSEDEGATWVYDLSGILDPRKHSNHLCNTPFKTDNAYSPSVLQ